MARPGARPPLEGGLPGLLREQPWLLQATIVSVGALVVLGTAFFVPNSIIFGIPDYGGSGLELVEGTVIEVLGTEEIDPADQGFEGSVQVIQDLRVELTQGEFSGDVVDIRQGTLGVGDDAIPYSAGDRVLLSTGELPDGTRVFNIQDYVRSDNLMLLLTAFVIAVVVVGGWQGARSVIALGVTLLILIKFIIPGILAGHDAVLITLVGVIAATVPALLLSHGLNWKTAAAASGAAVALIITGVLAYISVEAMDFTGVFSDEATFVQSQTAGQVSLRGLLLAGILIGSLGVLYDVTVLQASTIFELKRADPSLGFGELFVRASRVGRDHVAATVDTLVLAYAGASLPILLLVTIQAQPFEQLVNREFIAEEIVRALVGSLGIIAAVPLTNVIAAWIAEQRFDAGSEQERTEPA
ncbi:MAG: YibE/F family protein [Dehalococcoidia bacterium]|nr:YibE/F family protein [Dehalococcoidia bacterium]